MIRGLRLRNFRGFRDAELQLKPLTVLLGPNSAGKSAFGHAIASLSHLHREKRHLGEPSLTPENPTDAERWPVDLGAWQDLRTAGSREPVQIQLTTSEGAVSFGFGVPDGPSELLLSTLDFPPALTTSIRDVDPSRHFVPTGESVPLTSQVSGLSAAASPFPLRRGKETIAIWRDASGHEVQIGRRGLELLTVSHTSGTPLVLNNAAAKETVELLASTQYLRGSRRRPTRGYQRRPAVGQGLGYAGEYVADVLVSHTDPVGILTPTENPREWKAARGSLVAGLTAWLLQLGLASQTRAEPSRRNPSLLDLRIGQRDRKEDLDVTEVGFGLSQVIPVLAAGLLQTERGLLVVDLPEAHLHPGPQAPLADFFVSLALSGKHALVETHSEVFFHQLRLRVALQPELADLIAVYFIDEPGDEGCCAPRLIALDSAGEIAWPKGFFQETLEIEARIQEARLGRRLRPIPGA